MKTNNSIGLRFGFGVAALCALTTGGFAADAPAKAPAPAAETSMVPAAAPGVFSMQKKGGNAFHLVVTGHAFTNRSDIEKYLAYRAAEITMQQHGTWFTFTETRAKGDTAPMLKRDAAEAPHSFRMANFRPVWRYKSGSPAWQSWSPFSNATYFADGKDAKKISDFEVSADIVVHQGPMDDRNPLAYEAAPVSDLLSSQVSPPT